MEGRKTLFLTDKGDDPFNSAISIPFLTTKKGCSYFLVYECWDHIGACSSFSGADEPIYSMKGKERIRKDKRKEKREREGDV